MHQKIKHILVVDEEVELRHSIIRHLRRKGFVMDSAFGDAHAKHKIHTANRIGLSYDLVIRIFLGHHPAEIDFIDWIHQTHPEISIVVISGLGNTDWISSILNPEKDAHARNPQTPEELLSVITGLETRLLIGQQSVVSNEFSEEQLAIKER